MNKRIGKINKKVIDALNLEIEENTPIFIGEANIEHMKIRHPETYKKYGKFIPDIIEQPTYVARDEKKNSIEYIRKYIINKEMVLVIVRSRGKDKHFVRTMYIMAEDKIEKYKKYWYLKKIWFDNTKNVML